MKQLMMIMVIALSALSYAEGAAKKSLNLPRPLMISEFQNSTNQQIFKFAPVRATQLAVQSRNAWDGRPFAAIAELDIFDAWGKEIPKDKFTIAYADSEERNSEDGKAENAIDGIEHDFWHTRWSDAQPEHPHTLVIDLGGEYEVAGVRYLPRQSMGGGRIRTFALYAGKEIVK